MVEVPGKTTFYSQHGGLQIAINHGKYVMGEDGRQRLTGEKMAAFTPLPGGFGFLTTDDPEIIANLSKRDDVFGFEEFKRRSMTPQQREAEALNTAQRVITDNNRLLAEIETMKAQLAQASQKTSK